MLNNELLANLDNLPGWKPSGNRGIEALEHEQHMKILETIVNGSVMAGQTSSTVSNDYLRELWRHLRHTNRFFGLT